MKLQTRTKATKIRPQDRKLAELILFISERSEGDARFGAVKLNKLLFDADFLAYLHHGSSVTGQEYQKLHNGPAPRRLMPVRDALIAAGILAVREAEYHNRNQDRTFALREADLGGFTAEEVALVTDVIAANWDRNAAEINHLSYGYHGWEDVELGATIPYEIALLSDRPPTDRDVRRCRAASRRAAAALEGRGELVRADA
jgi:hypothetical protein